VDAEGVIRWSTPTGTVNLVVVGGTVVACPPDAAPWAADADARELWRRGACEGVDLTWLPAPAHRVVGRWWNGLFGTWTRRDLWLRTNDETWQVGVRDGRAEGTLRFPTEDQARQQLELLLAEGTWRSLTP
jgi:hypothetical protein